MSANVREPATLGVIKLPERPTFYGIEEEPALKEFGYTTAEILNIAVVGAIIGGLAVAFVNKYTKHPCVYLFIGGFLLALYYREGIAYGIALVMIADAVYQFLKNRGILAQGVVS